MLYNYKATNKDGQHSDGSIDAANVDVAIAALQRRGMIVLDVQPDKKRPFLARSFSLFGRIPVKYLVVLFRQIATLFEAQVSVLNTFKLLSAETDNYNLRQKLVEITDDIQSGTPISGAMSRHPDVFTDFHVSMIRSAEESGKLSETFGYLADYMERSYELVSKVKNALLYPAFVVTTFIVVMVLMMVVVIPQLSTILHESGQEIPIYTEIVIGVSNFLVRYGILLLILVIVGSIIVWRYGLTKTGKMALAQIRLSLPLLGNLYRKFYLSRIADNMNTMLTSGIPMIKAIEITSEVADNPVYKKILLESAELVKGGSSVSDAFSQYPEIPSIMVQMIRIGEESGRLGYVLDTLSRFYKREVNNALETLVGLIEPIMIVVLGLGVAVLLAAVLIPIYNIASGF